MSAQNQISNLFGQVAESLTAELTKKVNELEKKIDQVSLNGAVLSISLNGAPAVNLTTQASAILPQLLKNADLKQNVYIYGPAGSGKTTAAKQVAEALGLQFGSICLTAGASETWLFGRQTANGFIEGQFSKLYKEGGVFLADELDAADANMLISINSAIDSDSMLNPMSGELIKKHKDFIFIAAGNTNGLGSDFKYTGRTRLDFSTKSRFVDIRLDYDKKLERKLCLCKDVYASLQASREALEKNGCEEVIGTRDFIKFGKLKMAGYSFDEIFESLTASFSDSSKNLIKDYFDEPTPKKGKKDAVGRPVNDDVGSFAVTQKSLGDFSNAIPF